MGVIKLDATKEQFDAAEVKINDAVRELLRDGAEPVGGLLVVCAKGSDGETFEDTLTGQFGDLNDIDVLAAIAEVGRRAENALVKMAVHDLATEVAKLTEPRSSSTEPEVDPTHADEPAEDDSPSAPDTPEVVAEPLDPHSEPESAGVDNDSIGVRDSVRFDEPVDVTGHPRRQ